MHACELGTRCTMFFMALHRSSLHHTAASTGRVSGSSIKGKQVFDLLYLPPDSVAEHPVLKVLQLELSKFAFTYLKKSLALPPLLMHEAYQQFKCSIMSCCNIWSGKVDCTSKPGVYQSWRVTCVWEFNESIDSPLEVRQQHRSPWAKSREKGDPL